MKVNMVHSATGGGQLNISIMGLTLIQFMMLLDVYLMCLSSMKYVYNKAGHGGQLI